jgi:hypothetical protein
VLTSQMALRMPGYRVHNVGLIAAGTVIEYVLFQRYVQEHLRPGDTVVLVFFGNDFGDNVGQHNDDRIYARVADGRIEIVPPPPTPWLKLWKNRLKDASYLFNLATYCSDRMQQSRNSHEVLTKNSRRTVPAEEIRTATSDDAPAVQITRYYLEKLNKDCADKGVRFLVANVPGQAELGEDDASSTSDLCGPEEAAYREAFERVAKSLGLDTIDLMTPMVAAKQIARFQRMTFQRDFHWNAAGHTLAAETIADEILRRGKQ